MLKIFSNINKYRLLPANIASVPNYRAISNDPNAPIPDMPNPYQKEKQKCILCRLNLTPDYKNVKLLSQFQSSYTGRIYGKHITGLCEHKQKQVEREIKKAQDACLMGYYNKDVDFVGDPKLFDPENPIRPHRF